MMSVKIIVDWVNAYGSPIHIMDNEMLSIPFVADLDGKMYLSFFVYYIAGAYGNGEKKTMIRCIYYVNPRKLDKDIVCKDVKHCEYIPDIKLFQRFNIPENILKDMDKYDSLVDITDQILNNSEDMKKQVNRYADYFCACVSDQLKSYYWKYGKKYFTWLNSLL